jgi:hypothetical protein
VSPLDKLIADTVILDLGITESKSFVEPMVEPIIEIKVRLHCRELQKKEMREL